MELSKVLLDKIILLEGILEHMNPNDEGYNVVKKDLEYTKSEYDKAMDYEKSSMELEEKGEYVKVIRNGWG